MALAWGEKNTVIAKELRFSIRSVERWRRSWRGGGRQALRTSGPGVHTRRMGRRFDPREVVRSEGRALFAFLISDGGFVGPEVLESGLVYHHRSGLQIGVSYLGPREPEVTTTVRVLGVCGAPHSASLDCLWVAFGCGTLQDVPTSGVNGRTVAKRLRQQAEALRRLLPTLLTSDVDDAIRRCQGRLLPEG